MDLASCVTFKGLKKNSMCIACIMEFNVCTCVYIHANTWFMFFICSCQTNHVLAFIKGSNCGLDAY